MKLLITGAGGQLGHELSTLPLPDGWSRVSFDRAGLDISSRDQVLATVAAEKPDIILNAAAYTAVDKAEEDQDTAYAINRDGSAYLAEAAKSNGIPLIHISTDYVYDGSKNSPWVEGDPVAPLGVYGASKAAGEQAIRDVLNEHVILRTSWVYASHGANFVKTMLRVGADRDELTVVADQIGAPTAARDIARAMLSIAGQIDEGKTDGWGTYNFAAKGETSWAGFAEAIFAQAADRIGNHPTVKPIRTEDWPTPAARPANSVMDCGRIDAAFAPPRRTWQEGLAEVLDELLDQQ